MKRETTLLLISVHDSSEYDNSGPILIISGWFWLTSVVLAFTNAKVLSLIPISITPQLRNLLILVIGMPWHFILSKKEGIEFSCNQTILTKWPTNFNLILHSDSIFGDFIGIGDDVRWSLHTLSPLKLHGYNRSLLNENKKRN